MTFLQKHQRQMWLGYVRTWRGPVPGTCHLLIRARPLSCVASTRPRSTDKILPSDPFEHFTKRFWPEHRKLRRTRKDYCANSRPCEVTLLMLRAPAPLVHPLQILAPRASSKMIGRATALFCYWKNTCTFQIIPAYKSETWKNDKRKKNDNSFREQGFSTGFFLQTHVVKDPITRLVAVVPNVRTDASLAIRQLTKIVLGQSTMHSTKCHFGI